METIKSILVVSRMTPHCEEAICSGLALARRYDAKLHALHLVSNPIADMNALNAPGLIFSDEHKNYKDIQREAKEVLDKVISMVIKDGFPVNEIISDNDPVKEIARVVKEQKIDLIVMLAHEEGRLEHALFGGEMDAIIRSLPCTIMLVKSEPKPVSW
jgi:nucleotide-binding universal stress UspA family protein